MEQTGLTQRETLRKKRSMVLHQMQLMGVDTANWSRVDAFCQDSRITGKRFCQLSSEELDALLRKLRAIKRKQQTLNKKEYGKNYCKS